MFSAVPNRFKCRHNACFRDIIFTHKSLQFQIVSNSVRMHALETLFSHNFCRSKSFQIVSESAFSNLFKYRQNACLRDIVFQKSSAVSNRCKQCQNACSRDVVLFFFSAVPSSKISFQIASDSTIKRVCFQTFLGSFNFQNIVLNSVTRHRLVSLILTFSQHLKLSKHRLNSVKRNRSASLFLKCSKQFYLSFSGNFVSGEGPPTPSMFLFRDILLCPRYVPAQ